MLALPGTTRAAEADLRFVRFPPPDIEAGEQASAAWEAASGCTYRWKLDAPGDWLGGIHYALNKWSDWNPEQNVLLAGFILEGRYRITVQARCGNEDPQEIERAFSVHFVAPAIRTEGLNIDWSKVGAGPDRASKYRVLADEYRAQHLTWMEIYERERRALKLTTSGPELIDNFSRLIVERGQSELLRAADASVAAQVSKILAPVELYEIAKNAGLDMVLIYRNLRTNEAAFSAIAAYWAWKGYERLANEAD